MRLISCIAIACCAALSAHGEFADFRFIPPSKSAASPIKATAAMARDAVTKLSRNAFPRYQINDYAGQNLALRKSSAHPDLQVAVGAVLGWTSDQLFESPQFQDSHYVWRAAISSVDATALRLCVDLTAFAPDDELWVVDTMGALAFGPFGLADADGESQWLPTTMGDTAILLVTSPQAKLPRFTVESLSHHYEPMASKGTSCPVSADCITDTTLSEVSTGIGRLEITTDNGAGFLCSGALLNNPVTEDLEALFLTADHCFQDAGSIHATNLEVVWDVRTNGCPGAEPTDTEIAALPRSTGKAFLTNSTTFDAMLISLESVPVGTLGRAYLGWDTVTPRIGDAVVGLHHPQGTAMKESIGTVDDVGVDSSFGLSQNTMRWSEGITEGGSSGSPAMYNDGNYRVFGMLSNGNLQDCRNTNARLDQYSSFQEFFSLASGFINSATPPSAGSATYQMNGSTGTGGLNCTAAKRTVSGAAGDLALAALAVMTLLGIGALKRERF